MATTTTTLANPATTAPSQGSFSSSSSGISGGYTGNSLPLEIIICIFIGLAFYNTIELTLLIFMTFRHYSGLYFWSLLIASWGVIPYNLGFLIKFFNIGIPKDSGENGVTWVAVILITAGWWPMVTGQSVVLWSRLHILNRNEKLLRTLLWMIVIDAIILHIPTTVLTFGSNALSNPNLPNFVRGYNVMEKIQMTLFTVQETLISAVYVRETLKFLRLSLHDGARRTMFQLLSINVLIIIMDLGLLGCEYANLYIIETTLKGVVYSIKFKLEFAVLGKLVSFVTSNNPAVRKNSSLSLGGYTSDRKRSCRGADHYDELPDFFDPTRATGDITHAAPISPTTVVNNNHPAVRHFSSPKASLSGGTLHDGKCSVSATPSNSSSSAHSCSIIPPPPPSAFNRRPSDLKRTPAQEIHDFEANLARFHHVENIPLEDEEDQDPDPDPVFTENYEMK
ncbi:MAG: hypothetical protein Q9227_001749 [Pyrenula ochraceoflavens]